MWWGNTEFHGFCEELKNRENILWMFVPQTQVDKTQVRIYVTDVIKVRLLAWFSWRILGNWEP